MIDFTSRASETGAPLVRDIAVLLLTGAVLGLAFNLVMLTSEPARALPWLRVEQKIVRLEDLPAQGASAAVTGGGVPPSGAASAAHPAGAALASPAAGHGALPRAGDAPAQPEAPAPAPERPAHDGQAAAAAPAGGTGASPPATAADATPQADVPVIPESKVPIEAQLATVQKLYAAGAALFVDARSPEEYAEAHIAGAVNLPFDDVFEKPELAGKVDPHGRPIVTYCGGGDCELSRNLAFSLIDAGQHRVVVFTGGMPAWKTAGLAVHSGAKP